MTAMTESPSALPEPPDPGGSADELCTFAALQERLATLFARVFPDPRAPRTVVVNPSLSFDPELIAAIPGVQHYEERMLCLLMLLRLPRTRVIYLTSMPIPAPIVAYYLNLLPGVPGHHARRRLTLIPCYDPSPKPLSRKLLARPRTLARLRDAIGDPELAHMACFTVTELERTLAVRLEIPIYGCDPSLAHLGTKSGGRRVFREAGVDLPDGVEDLHERADLVAALAELKGRAPELGRAVVKLDEGASGEGNALFDYRDCPAGRGRGSWIERMLAERLRCEAESESFEHYLAKLGQMGGIVEAWLEGEARASPSAQVRIDPLGRVHPISTHDQMLGGPGGQIFLGSSFPAVRVYRLSVQEAGVKVARVLQRHGVIGRLGVDFVSLRENGYWRHYAIEINLRKGGTTHTFLMLDFLLDGHYDPETGLYLTRDGQPRYSYSSDNLASPAYRGLTPDDLIDIAVEHGIHFHGASQQGVVFHLMGSLSQFGKLGLLCVGDSRRRARELYEETQTILEREARG